MRARWQIPLVSLGIAAVLQVGPSCTDGFESLNEVTTVRVLSVVADKPYAQPGEDVTLYLTYHDGRDVTPKPVEVTWIAGCVLPTGAPFAACYPQLEAAVQQIGGDPPDADDAKTGIALIQQEIVPAELSGTPNGVSFNAPIPKQLFEIYEELIGDEDEEIDSLVAYVFFTVCAGRVRPEAPDSEAVFPLGCFDANGNRVGADGFVPGYTEVFIFKEERPNENPPVESLEIDGEPMGESPEEATVVKRCDPGKDEGGDGCTGSGSEETRSEEELCPELDVEVIVADVAEPDPQLTESTGNPHREVLWVDYYADGGGLEDEQVLVSHAVTGLRNRTETVWRPPEDPGLVTIWAVVHDNRGGATVKRGFLRVE